jgi:hypothetical protein
MPKIIACDYQNLVTISNSSTSSEHITGQKNIIKTAKDDSDYDSQWIGQSEYGTLSKKYSKNMFSNFMKGMD